MNQAKAEMVAQECADRTRVDYVIVKARNGQWMCERRTFVFENGLLYNGRPMIVFKPREPS